MSRSQEESSQRAQGAEEARRRLSDKRRAFQETLEAVKDRLGTESARVEEVVDRAKAGAEKADAFVRRHPWLCAALSLGVGFALAGGARRRARIGTSIGKLPSGEQLALVIQTPRRTPIRDVLLMVGTALARRVANDVLQALLHPPEIDQDAKDR